MLKPLFVLSVLKKLLDSLACLRPPWCIYPLYTQSKPKTWFGFARNLGRDCLALVQAHLIVKYFLTLSAFQHHSGNIFNLQDNLFILIR